MCGENAYTSKHRKDNTQSVLTKGECICDCKLVRFHQQAESHQPITSNAKPTITLAHSGTLS